MKSPKTTAKLITKCIENFFERYFSWPDQPSSGLQTADVTKFLIGITKLYCNYI